MIGDTGISSSYKVPRFIAKIVFAAGAVSASSGRLACLLVGMKTSAGSMTADAGPIRCFSEDEADTYAGVGSQLARMAYKALLVPSLELWIAAVTEPGAGTAGTITIVLTGTTGNGIVRYRLGGTAINASIASTMTLDEAGAAITAAFNAKSKLPCTAAYDAPSDTITLTLRNKGASGRDWILYHDPTDKPSTLTLTPTGSSTINTYGVKFGAAGTGTGAEDVTTLLTKLTQRRWARVAVGHNDATNAALWKTHVNTKAGPLSLLLDQLVFASSAALATAQSLAQTTLNAFRAQVLWMRNSESHPCEIAAANAAIRAVSEQGNPITDYDGMTLAGIAPYADIAAADQATDTEQDTALNNGLTPIVSINGESKIVRSITSYCLNGSNQDERCLDIGDVAMTDYATMDLKLLYETEFRPANPKVGPNPADGEEPPPAGVAYPDLWKAYVVKRARGWYDSTWTEERPVGSWEPLVDYSRAGKYITCDLPLPVRRLQHRIDQVVKQTSNSV